MQNALMIDPRYSAFFGPQDAGSGSGTFGNGNGAGWMQGLANLPGAEAYYTAAQGNGDSEQAARIDPNALYAYLQAQGYNLNEQGMEGGDAVERWISNAQGGDVGAREQISTEDNNFWTGALMAGALAGGATAGWASAGNGIGGATAGAEGLSGMDLAADAALGSGNNMYTAGEALGRTAVAAAPAASGGGGPTSSPTAPNTTPPAGGNGLQNFFSGNAPAGEYLRAGSTLAGLYTTNRAADAAQQGEANNLALLTRMYDDNKANNQPLLDLRNAQIPRINALMADPSSVSQEPGYQFGLKQGNDLIARQQASRGGYNSSARENRTIKFGQDYAGTKLDQSLGRLMNVAGLGQQGANNQQSANTNFGQAGGQSMVNSGSNRGSGYIGYGNTLQNGVNNYMQDSYFDQAFKPRGG